MSLTIKYNHDIHIAVLAFFTTGIRAEQPCFQHRLCCKVSCNNLL